MNTNGWRVGQVAYEVQQGTTYARVFNGRVWQSVAPGGLGWKQVLAENTADELFSISVKVAGEWRWASDFVAQAVQR